MLDTTVTAFFCIIWWQAAHVVCCIPACSALHFCARSPHIEYTNNIFDASLVRRVSLVLSYHPYLPLHDLHNLANTYRHLVTLLYSHYSCSSSRQKLTRKVPRQLSLQLRHPGWKLMSKPRWRTMSSSSCISSCRSRQQHMMLKYMR